MTSSTASENKAGLIGVGTMGRHMLQRLRSAGYAVAAFDPAPSAMDYIREQGADACSSAAEVAASADVLILSLPMPQHVVETMDAIEGSLTARHIVVDTSTVSPGTTKACAQRAASRGAGYVDAPILGRPSAAGNWLMPSGGSEADIERARPYLRTFARDAVRVGESGAGNTFKLLNQLMFSVINAVSAEIMALTDVMGIDRRTFFDVIAQSGAATVSGLFKETAIRAVEDRFDQPNFTVGLLCKDAGLGLQMARDAGVSPLISSFVQSINENAKGVGLAGQDTSALVKVFREYFSRIA